MNRHPKQPALYAQRNLLQARSVGALENAREALRRLRSQKSTPLWLEEALVGIVARLTPIPAAMADYRDEAW